MLVTDEVSLIVALRAWADERNVSREEIDRVAGLTAGHASKLLALPPIKYFGPLSAAPSFWAMVGCLGLAVQLVEDPTAAARFTSQMGMRDRKNVRRHALIKSGRIPWLITAEKARELGRKGGQNSLTKRSVGFRKKIAKMGVKARWAAKMAKANIDTSAGSK